LRIARFAQSGDVVELERATRRLGYHEGRRSQNEQQGAE
jgi:hypothetical protein